MTWNEIKNLARLLRKNQTKEESKLWELLRNRRLMGRKFLRQHPIIYNQFDRDFFFIADFYCHEARIVLEIDGKIHLQQQDYDEQRDLIIQAKGIQVLRIKNEDVNENVELVLQNIQKLILTRMNLLNS